MLFIQEFKYMFCTACVTTSLLVIMGFRVLHSIVHLGITTSPLRAAT